MYNDVPTTCFGRFLTGHHQVGIQCQRTYYADTVNTCISNTGLTTRPIFVNEILPLPSPICFCTHTDTDVYTYSRYIVPLTLYSNLMMAS